MRVKLTFRTHFFLSCSEKFIMNSASSGPRFAHSEDVVAVSISFTSMVFSTDSVLARTWGAMFAVSVIENSCEWEKVDAQSSQYHGDRMSCMLTRSCIYILATRTWRMVNWGEPGVNLGPRGLPQTN
jgi:hypothetical protein